MLKERSVLNSRLETICRGQLGNKRQLQKYAKDAFEQHNLPLDIAMDYITLKKPFAEATQHEIFIIASVVEEKLTNEFFDKSEIKEYSKKFKAGKLKFPLTFDVVQIREDQWIGKITVKDLMQLRDAQLINYDENAQRPLQRIVNKDDIETWKIALNKQAVEKIKESFENRDYLPNTITLHFHEDPSNYYNEEEKCIYIGKEEPFDILDGYHRYIAMSDIYNVNKDFNYPMELRLVCYSESKEKQFIWQEDQKTKMRKVDSKSLNQNDLANRITSLVSDNEVLRSLISRNAGIIHYGELSEAIRCLYVKMPVGKRNEIKFIKEISKEIATKLNYIIDSDFNIIDERWDRLTIVSAMAVCKYENKPTAKTVIKIKKQFASMDKQITSKIANAIIRFYEGKE